MLSPLPHSFPLRTQFTSRLSPPLSLSLPPSSQQARSTASCDRITLPAHAPHTSQVHYICTHRPSLVGPHTAYVPAKYNVTAPPKPSFRAITGQISPSKAPVCSLIDGTPAFFLRVHAPVLLFCGRAHSCVCFYIPTFIYVCTCVSLCVCSRPELRTATFPLSVVIAETMCYDITGLCFHLLTRSVFISNALCIRCSDFALNFQSAAQF